LEMEQISEILSDPDRMNEDPTLFSKYERLKAQLEKEMLEWYRIFFHQIH